MRRLVCSFAVVANFVFVDALVKQIAVAKLKGAAAITVIPNVFNLAYVENRGCAWGLFQGQVWPLALFAIAALVILIWKRRSIFCPGLLGAFAEPLLYAGIIGNLLDRLFRGYVVDLFDFHWGVHHFPCFNVADSLICVAAGLLILSSFFSPKKEKTVR